MKVSILARWLLPGSPRCPTWSPSTSHATAAFQTADIKNLFATDGTLDTAVINKLWTDVVNSRKITTNMLAVGDFTNLVPNGRGELGNAGVGWTSGLVYDTGDKPSGVVASFKSTAGQGTFSANTQDFLVEPGAQYLFSAWIKADKPNSKFYFEMRDQAGALMPLHHGVNSVRSDRGDRVGYPISTSPSRPYGRSTTRSSPPGPTTSKLRVASSISTTQTAPNWAPRWAWPACRYSGAADPCFWRTAWSRRRSSSRTWVLISDIIAGNPAGQHARMTPTGFKVLAPVDGGAPAEVVRMGNSDGTDVVAVVGADGLTKAGLNADGTVTGQDADIANDITLAGDSLLERLNALPHGVVAWRQFPSGSNSAWPTLGSAGGEVGLFEIGWDTSLDDPARLYSVSVPPILLKSASGSATTIGLVMRFTDDGSAPTVNSPRILHDYGYASAGGFGSRGFNDVLISSANGPYIRVLVTMYSNGAVGLDSTALPEVVVKDLGLAIPQTGSITTGGGGSNPPPTNPVVTKTVTYSSTSVQSYLGNNAQYNYNAGKGYQGLQPGTANGNLKSLWTFPSLTSLLTGATVNKIEAYFYFEHWYSGSGGTARIVAHGNSGQPTAYSSLILAISSPNWPRGAGRWVTIPSSLYAGFKSGTYKGFGLEGDGTYNTYGIANAAKIRVTYTK